MAAPGSHPSAPQPSPPLPGPLPFVKMHGIGNDYVYLDAVVDPTLSERTDLPELARLISDRHTGIGSDGLILVCLPTVSASAHPHPPHCRMRMFNADGSESEMCGNGVRCVAKFAHDRLGLRDRPLRVETGRGVLAIEYTTGPDGLLAEATVDMGEPILEPADVPFDPGAASRRGEHAFELRGSAERVWTMVSMGNPHAVSFDWDESELQAHDPDVFAALGRVIETHAAFPRRVNVHGVAVRSRSHAVMRTWERGAGLTQACGTGACAVLVAGVLMGWLDREATLTLPGGDLRVRWDDATGRVFMTGPATFVCDGVWLDPRRGSRGGSRSGAASTLVPATTPRPTITTERLVLRPAALADAADLARLAGDRRVYDMTLLIPHPYRIEHAHAWIATHQRTWDSGRGFDCVITLAGSGEIIGGIGLVIPPRQPVGEIGYWIAPAHWNRGYATEAARAMIGYGFESLNLHRISAYHFVGNPASGRVLEKAGMTREATCRAYRFKDGQPQDSVLWAAVRQP